MGKKREETAQVLANRALTGDIRELVLKTSLSAEAQPGQFVSLFCRDRARLLPRPISICDADPAAGTLRLVFRVVGAGTEEFAGLREGDRIRAVGCLGSGYDLQAAAGRHVLLAGGGLGVPPMLFLMKKLAALQGAEAPASVTAAIGYRDRNTFLLEDFQCIGRVLVASDDGSVGIRGTVLDAICSEETMPEVICACGPLPMLRALAAFSDRLRADGKDNMCYVSLEERMACGIGTCLGCVVRTTEIDHHSQVKNSRICTEGPVFESRQIDWERLGK